MTHRLKWKMTKVTTVKWHMDMDKVAIYVIWYKRDPHMLWISAKMSTKFNSKGNDLDERGKGMFRVLSVFSAQRKSCMPVEFRFSLYVGMTKLS